MDMKHKEQLLYFFLDNKVRLSQYDYKFMSNLQTIITNKNRITSNQAELFNNLIEKYKKQLSKNMLDSDELKALPWRNQVVESSVEYTGAMVSLVNNEITIRVPFHKNFITAFRNVKNNTFAWDKETKLYKTMFDTVSLKIAATELKKYFEVVRFDDNLQQLLNDINKFEAPVYNPTLMLVNDRLVVIAANDVLSDIIKDIKLDTTPQTLFKLSQLGIAIDASIYANDSELEFASKSIYEAEITELETVVSWMKNIGCDNVIAGRGLRNIIYSENLEPMVKKYGMNLMVHFATLPPGTSIVIQHTSNVDMRNVFIGNISKTVVLKDSRPVEVK